MKKLLILLTLVAVFSSALATTTNDLITVKGGNLIAFCGKQFGEKLPRPASATGDEGDVENFTITAIKGLPTWRERRVLFGYDNGIIWRGLFSLAIPLKEGAALKDGKVQEWVRNAFAVLTSEVFANMKEILVAENKESNPKLNGWGEDKGMSTAEWEFDNGYVLLCHFKESTQWKLIVMAVASPVEEKSITKDSEKTVQKTATEVKAFGTKSGEIGYITLPNGKKIEMIWCEPGRFFMGAQDCELKKATYSRFWKPEDGEYYNQDEIPRHMVKITKGFWMGKYPISQEQYQDVMKQNPSETKKARDAVTNVSWNDAKLFCEELSEETGLECGLPSEAQWEYATRAGTTTVYWWGDTYNRDLAYKANPWGFEQMTGRWHWCLDCYSDDFYARSPKSDPVCNYYKIRNSAGEKQNVIRGGLDDIDSSDGSDMGAARSATRSSQSSGWNNGTFRIVCPALNRDN